MLNGQWSELEMQTLPCIGESISHALHSRYTTYQGGADRPACPSDLNGTRQIPTGCMGSQNTSGFQIFLFSAKISIMIIFLLHKCRLACTGEMSSVEPGRKTLYTVDLRWRVVWLYG